MKELPDYSKTLLRGQNLAQSSAAIVSLMYWVICSVIVVIIVFSWYFAIEISTLSPGIIRPNAETSVVRSSVGGRIKQSFIRENQSVRMGDTLYLLETDALNIRQKYLSGKLNEIKNNIEDLRILTSPGDLKTLQSPLFRQSWTTFLQRLSEANTRQKKAHSDYRRNLTLHNQKVIADAELETYKYELDRSINEVSLTRKAQLSQWQNDLANYESERPYYRIGARAG
jgi:HlyD family secretion protein